MILAYILVRVANEVRGKPISNTDLKDYVYSREGVTTITLLFNGYSTFQENFETW